MPFRSRETRDGGWDAAPISTRYALASDFAFRSHRQTESLNRSEIRKFLYAAALNCAAPAGVEEYLAREIGIHFAYPAERPCPACPTFYNQMSIIRFGNSKERFNYGRNLD